MLNATMLSVIEEAGVAVLTLTESLEQHEFYRSRLTRTETDKQLTVMANTLGAISPRTQIQMAEIDWDGWRTIARELREHNSEIRDVLWFTVKSLVPATLMWLRVYRKNEPHLFELKPTNHQTLLQR